MPKPISRVRRAAALAQLALVSLFSVSVAGVVTPASASQLQAEPAVAETSERAMSPAPLRHLLVKALGQGATPQEAEEQAVQNARALAAKHLLSLGGAQALLPGAEGQRVVNLKHFPAMGFGSARAVVLVELRLRGQAEPLPAGANLLTLRASVSAGALNLEASRSCEAVAAYLPAKDAKPEFLAGVQPFRLSPGRPLKHPLPAETRGLSVLACTGGLSLPADPDSLEEAFTKARAGRPRPSQLQGVVSDCVEMRLAPSQGGARSMRLKSSEAPVNMSGAAGREGGLPVPPKTAP